VAARVAAEIGTVGVGGAITLTALDYWLAGLRLL
jgi:hypothetical protein